MRAKLALSAVISILLALALAGSAWFAFTGIAARTARDQDAQALAAQSQTAHSALMRMAELAQHLLAAQTPAAIQAASDAIAEQARIVRAEMAAARKIAAALDLAAMTAAADGFATAFDTYVTRIDEVAVLRRELIDERDKRADAALSLLVTLLDPIRQSATAAQGTPNLDTIGAMVAESAQNANNLSLRFLATGDVEKANSAQTMLDQLQRFVVRAAEISKGQVASGSVDAMVNSAEFFRKSVNTLVERAKALATASADKLAPARAEAERQMLLITEGLATQARDSLTATADDVDTAITQQVAFATLNVLVLVVASVLIGRAITRPTAALTRTLEQLARADYSVTVPERQRQDEFGQMARGLEVLREAGLERQRLREAQDTQRLAAESQRRTLLSDVAARFEAQIGELAETVAAAARDMEAQAQALAALSEQTKADTENVAQATDAASNSVHSVASAAEELSTSIGEIERQVAQSVEIAQRAVGETRRSSDEVTALETAASRIGDIVQLVTDIAEQTNLLALNATIEAARAGDAGRGFAVVANEVKSLAGQTSKATEDIAVQVQAIQQATQVTATTLRGVTATIETMNSISSNVATSVEHQQAATSEIARNVQQAAGGTNSAARAVVEVRETADRSGDACVLLLSRAKSLSTTADGLVSAMGSFLAHLRAA